MEPWCTSLSCNKCQIIDLLSINFLKFFIRDTRNNQVPSVLDHIIFAVLWLRLIYTSDLTVRFGILLAYTGLWKPIRPQCTFNLEIIWGRYFKTFSSGCFYCVFYAELVATVCGDIYHHFWSINMKGPFIGWFFLPSLQILATCENIRQKKHSLTAAVKYLAE